MSISRKTFMFESGSELHDLLVTAGKPLEGVYRQIVEFDGGSQEENDISGQYCLIEDGDGKRVPLFTPARFEDISLPFVISEESLSVYGLGAVLSRKDLS